MLRLPGKQGGHHLGGWFGRVGVRRANAAGLLVVAEWQRAVLLSQWSQGSVPRKAGGLGIQGAPRGGVSLVPAAAQRACAGGGMRSEPAGRGGA